MALRARNPSCKLVHGCSETYRSTEFLIDTYRPGFTFATDWVVTDFWDVALRYRKEIAGFEIAAGIGYFPDCARAAFAPSPS